MLAEVWGSHPASIGTSNLHVGMADKFSRHRANGKIQVPEVGHTVGSFPT